MSTHWEALQGVCCLLLTEVNQNEPRQRDYHYTGEGGAMVPRVESDWFIQLEWNLI
jgi:hypothetical protein